MKTELLADNPKSSSARELAKTSRYKPQARTEVMKNRILDAAQEVFAERGFDNTNLDLVAAQAGCSRGAIYAHYASKDEVFLELFQERIASLFANFCRDLEREPDLQTRISIFRRWILDQFSTPAWGILMLEFKLYSIRRPDISEKLLQIYGGLGYERGDFETLLFGSNSNPAVHEDLSKRLTLLSSLLNGLILEQRLRPGRYSQDNLREYAGEIFDCFLASHV